MNTFFATAGRATANVVDGAIDVTKTAYVATGHAGVSFAAGWKSQRRLNAMARRGVEVIQLTPVRA
jgi:hypothetical protein